MPYTGNKPSAVPLTSADIADSIITSAKIVDGTIVNADINASAAIPLSKLSGVGFTLGTSVATTSGTAFDFTGIPSTAKLIIINFHEMSLSGGDNFYVQIGDSNGISATGYISSSAYSGATGSYTSDTAAYTVVSGGGGAASILSGICFIALADSTNNTWVSSHTGKHATNYVVIGGGSKSLSSTLTQVRITKSGANTFDAGKLNIMYI